MSAQASKASLKYRHHDECGTRKGTLVLDRGGWKVYDRRDSRAENGGDLDRPHLENFVHAIRTREQPSAALTFVQSAERLCHIGIEAYRTGGAVRDVLDARHAAGV